MWGASIRRSRRRSARRAESSDVTNTVHRELEGIAVLIHSPGRGGRDKAFAFD